MSKRKGKNRQKKNRWRTFDQYVGSGAFTYEQLVQLKKDLGLSKEE